MVTTHQDLVNFALRLNSVLDDADFPAKGKNRQEIVGKRFGVSQKGARKWLEAEGWPSMRRAVIIATELKVCVEWLLTGNGPKYPGDSMTEEERWWLSQINSLSESQRNGLKIFLEGQELQPNTTHPIGTKGHIIHNTPHKESDIKKSREP